MGDLLDGYHSATWDEMFDPEGNVRPPYRTLHDVLQTMSPEDFDRRCQARDRTFRDQGITFSLSGEERPFPLDLVPRLISAEEWSIIERGVGQRVRALEAFLADVYGPGHIQRDGIVPSSVVHSSSHFHRAVTGIDPPNGVRIHVAGIDLVRGADGQMAVLEDNIRTPSGISYVIENRRTTARVFPELFGSYRIWPVDGYPVRLLHALRAAAPPGTGEPTVVVLTPGVYNSAYFEHTFLARQMGVELVEARDLVCRGNVVYMRSTTGELKVDVVYRRIDDEFLDPLHFRGDSLVGCPGIVNAARAGNVVIANAVGNGVADDKLVYTYVPEMIRYYLNEAPILPNVPTYRLADEEQRRHALDRLHELVVKPVAASGGYGLVIGPVADEQTLAGVRSAIEASPRGWIAQEVVALSTSPTNVGGCLRARHVDFRPFAVNDGTRVWVAPGGLTRVALREGNLIVNSSQGGGSKDTWVLAPLGAAQREIVAVSSAPLPPEAGMQVEPGPALSQSQQQQQQGSAC